MVTYIFYYIRILYILFTLIFQKYKKICRKEKRYSRKRAQNHYSNIQIMNRKTTTLRTLYVHVVLNGVICPQILYDIVLYARHFLLVKFFSQVLLKAGVNMKAVFWLVITALTQISRLRFKQSRISMLIPEIYVLGRFVSFLVIFRYIWR